MTKGLWRGIICGFVAIAASGCGDSNEKPKPAKAAGDTKTSTVDAKRDPHKKLVIAVIPKGTLHDFWKSIHAGAIKAERELGNVEIRWQGPAREDDREQQIKVVENCISRKVDAIVLAPLDKRALIGPVETAKSRGIPVVIIDSALDQPDAIASFVATNNFHGGEIAGEYLGKSLGGKGNVILLRYQVNSASTEQRESGFLDALKKKYPDIKILSDEQYSGATREEALAKAENLLTRYGDKVQGWFCPCEPVSYGTLRAMQNKNLAGKVKVVGFDATPEMVAALRSGQLSGLVLQDPVNMGYLGVKAAVDVLNGKAVQKEVSTGENLITKENIDLPRSKELHSPDLSKWLGE